ncbi:acyl-CoA thioesterase [Brevibacterium album]|uniref:acyl-CoA thioesterase n=1 Tax=Brevibacterium album TaxID=417948 RepID=UPI0004229F99|nr:thioesterase family protein [Brevibacterium album]
MVGEAQDAQSARTPGEQPLSGFPLRAFDKLRYADTDRQGHVNNAVYATFFETGRVELADRLRQVSADPAREFVLAQITIEYRRELLWPGEVQVGTRVARIGTSSIGVEQLLVCEGLVHARAESVMVLTDTGTRRSTPLDPGARATLETLMGR